MALVFCARSRGRLSQDRLAFSTNRSTLNAQPETRKRKNAQRVMSSYQDRIEISTTGHSDMHDLTEPVTQIVRVSGIETGLAHIHNVGSPGAEGTIEFEPGLQQDLPEVMDEIAPPERG